MRLHLLLALLLTLPSCSKQPSGSISGTLREATLLHPVHSVVVKLPKLGISTQTDSMGRFVFSDIPRGKYTIAFEDTFRLIAYDFPTPSVEVRVDSITAVDVVAVPRFDLIRKYDPCTLSFLKPSMRAFWGAYIFDLGPAPAPPERIIIEDSVKRFVLSLNQLQGLVEISTPENAVAYVRLLSTPSIRFEYNELGAWYCNAEKKNPNNPCGLPLDEFERLGLSEPTVQKIGGDVFEIVRFICRHDRVMFRIKEQVTGDGRYQLLKKDSVGVAKNLPLCLAL